MVFVADPVELVTAFTDLLMALAGLVSLRVIWQYRFASPWRANLWLVLFSIFAFTAFLGAIHHGLALPAFWYDFSWSTIFFSLGVLIGLFVVALSYDLSGVTMAKRVLPVMMIVALGFFLVSTFYGQDFRLFLLYEATALVAAGLGYFLLALRQVPGTLQISIGLLLTIVAATVQATRAISFVPAYPFDHNAAYHVIQIAGICFLTAGIRRGLIQASEGPPA